MLKTLITTFPFGNKSNKPIALMKENSLHYELNPFKRKITELELANNIERYDVLIAGTEPITQVVLKKAKNLKFISRVGIGLDNIDLEAVRKKNIKISYTPDAPTPAVSELTLCLILDCLRKVSLANSEIHNGIWNRHFGRRISEVTFGIIGVGRIGQQVIEKLLKLGAKRVYVNDIQKKEKLTKNWNISWVEKEIIFKECDVISLHVPLTQATKNMISEKILLRMKKNAVLINTSRGGIINEVDLASVLSVGHLSGVALDVFDNEPYKGNLCQFDRCVLTSHMGSMSEDCRERMELEATEEVLRFLKNKPLKNEVPEYEYFNK